MMRNPFFVYRAPDRHDKALRFPLDERGDATRTVVVPLFRRPEGRWMARALGVVSGACVAMILKAWIADGVLILGAVELGPFCAVLFGLSVAAEFYKRRITVSRVAEDEPGDFHVERDSGLVVLRRAGVALVLLFIACNVAGRWIDPEVRPEAPEDMAPGP